MYKAAVLTLSDKGHAGLRDDASGVFLAQKLREAGYEVVQQSILPDERELISAELAALCDSGDLRLVMTTGGTGFSRRDVTPEATLDVVDRLCPGIPEAMRVYSLQITKRAMLSRAQAGIRKNTLIVNLPGSKKAVEECLEAILDALEHGLKILAGDAAECAR